MRKVAVLAALIALVAVLVWWATGPDEQPGTEHAIPAAPLGAASSPRDAASAEVRAVLGK